MTVDQRVYLKFTSTQPVAPTNLTQSKNLSDISHLMDPLPGVAYVFPIGPKVGAASVKFMYKDSYVRV